MKSSTIPVREKYMLANSKVARYYSIGMKRLRMIAEEHLGGLCRVQRKQVSDNSGKA